MLNSSQYERYSRQMMLPQLGESGQQKLLAAKVLVIGAGGLGCPVLQYLSGAGVGSIGIADDDIVSLSNLHRQVLFSVADIGELKAQVAATKLKQLNSDVSFDVIIERITNANAIDLISNYDLVLDGSDNFATRYIVNDACVLLKKPLVHGSIFRFEGQVAVFNVNGSTNYRDLFPTPPAEAEVPNCAEAGVIGVLPAIIGALMANEAIKLIVKFGDTLIDKLLTYHSLYNTFYEVTITPNKEGRRQLPQDRVAFENNHYNNNCCQAGEVVRELTIEEFDELVAAGRALMIDVRERGEHPVIDEFEHVKLPLSAIKEKPPKLTAENVVLFCQSGKRSREAAGILNHLNDGIAFYSLKDGILQWKNKQQQTL